MAIGTTAAVLLGLGAAGAGAGISKIMGSAAKAAVEPIPLPQPPNPEAAVDKGAEIAKKKRAAATQSVYTSPLGVAGEAALARTALTGKSKLGE